MMNRQRIGFSPEELDLLDDVIGYYMLSDFGGGDHGDPTDQAALRGIQARVQAARERVQS